VGSDVAALARVRHLSQVPHTVVLAAPLDLWLAVARAQPDRCRRRMLPGPFARVSLRCAGVTDAGRVMVRSPVLHNLPISTLAEGSLELLAWTQRAAGGGRDIRAVLSVQHFLPARASVLVSVDPAAGQQRMRACWGMAEPLSGPVYFDEVTVSEAAGVGTYRVARKETASAPAAGGTCTVVVPDELRDAPVLTLAVATRVVDTARTVGNHLGPVELEFVFVDDEAHLVRCEHR